MRYTIFLTLLVMTGVNQAAAQDFRAQDFRIATWNLEWLMEPKVLRSLRTSCVPSGALPRGLVRVIPCDVAQSKERSAADFAALARYAARIDAQVVALQEVDGRAPARRLFPDHNFCFSARAHVQNLGFAIRKSVPYRCDGDLVALSLGDTVRRGVQLTIFPGTANEMHLLAVHLKSGCGRRALDGDKTECATLARQAPVLEQWIDAQAAEGRLFAVLGDFNRDLKWDGGDAGSRPSPASSLWLELNDGDPPGAELTLAADQGLFQNCSVAQNFRGFIDQIVLGKALAARAVKGSMVRVTYENADVAARRLSDHCPVSLALRLE